MTAPEVQVREQILQAAARLTGEGLIERTWGNISARVSDTQFLITPSGLAYETLRPDQLVLVNIADASWEGDIKPSSEKGIHADAYRLRPDVNFVIHTHQYYASVAGIEGRALTGFIHPLLGKRVPCAAYGLPGTKRLRRAVEAEEIAWPDCRAFLLRSHGALCLGRDMEDAFAAARALEEVCEARVRDRMEERQPPDCIGLLAGESRRQGDSFRWWDGQCYPINGSGLPAGAALHAAVYRAGDHQYIVNATNSLIRAVSERGSLRPWLDDLAQIAGPSIRCVREVPPAPRQVEAAIRGRNAVLIRGGGALCAGQSEEDARAVCALLEKSCMAQLYAESVPGCRPLHPADAVLQRLIYQKSYKRKRDLC